MGIYIIYVLQSPLMHICIIDRSSANRSIAAHGVSSHELPAGFSLYWSSYDRKKLAITDKSQREDWVPVKASGLGGSTQKSSHMLSHLRGALHISMPIQCIGTSRDGPLCIHSSSFNFLIWSLPLLSTCSNTLLLSCSPTSSSLKTNTFSHHHPQPLGTICWRGAAGAWEGLWEPRWLCH